MPPTNPYKSPETREPTANLGTLAFFCNAFFWLAVAIIAACLIWHGTLSHLFHSQKSTQKIYWPYWETAQLIAPPVIIVAIVVAFVCRFAAKRFQR